MMRKLLVSLLGVMLLAGSCSKSKNDSKLSGADGLDFEVNGTHYFFDSVRTTIDTTGGYYLGTIYRFKIFDDTTKGQLAVEFVSHHPSLPGTYQLHNEALYLESFEIDLIRNDSQTQYKNLGQQSFDFTVSSAESSTLSGHFTGSLSYDEGIGHTDPVSGTFRLPYGFYH